MPRMPLSPEERIEYKILNFKRWVREQMAGNDMTQESLGKAIGVSQSQVSQMLKIKDIKKKGEKKKPDNFTLEQILIIFDLFEADESTKKKLLTL